jgi:hypothetical protein
MTLFHQIPLLCLALVLALPAPVAAQEPPPALVVRLRDVDGRGVPNIVVLVLDTAGTTVLARATTGTDGSASFGPLPLAEVRVRVEGRLPDGTALQLPGQDAAGIRVILGAPPVMLELRSEPDGTVLPDPALELALEIGVAPDGEGFGDVLGALPTARPAARPSAAPAFSQATPPVAAPTQPPVWPAVLLLSLLLLAIGVVLLRLSRELRP